MSAGAHGASMGRWLSAGLRNKWRLRRLRGDWTYAYRSVKAHGQAVIDYSRFRLALARRSVLQKRAPRGGGPSGGA